MVEASKILTVSYGTFSCTLEGFDEPLSTMREIAEYFRDLASEDRYFGAEPPTPDAEMLHAIAQRETQRRVEAQVKDNGVVLRQIQREDAAAPVEPVHASPSQGPAPVGEPELTPVAESVAAKLQRIRAAVARAAAPEPLINTAFAEDEHAEQLYEGTPIETAFEGVEAEPAEDESIVEHFGGAKTGGAEAEAAEAPEEVAAAPEEVADEAPVEVAEEEPLETAQAEEPVELAEAEAPVELAEADEPVEFGEAEAPVEPAEAEEPVELAEAEAPVELAEAEEPVELAEAEAPVELAEAEEPVEVVELAEEPVAAADAEEPVEALEAEETVDVAEVEEPAEAEEPVEAAVAEEPYETAGAEDIAEPSEAAQAAEDAEQPLEVAEAEQFADTAELVEVAEAEEVAATQEPVEIAEVEEVADSAEPIEVAEAEEPAEAEDLIEAEAAEPVEAADAEEPFDLAEDEASADTEEQPIEATSDDELLAAIAAAEAEEPTEDVAEDFAPEAGGEADEAVADAEAQESDLEAEAGGATEAPEDETGEMSIADILSGESVGEMPAPAYEEEAAEETDDIVEAVAEDSLDTADAEETAETSAEDAIDAVARALAEAGAPEVTDEDIDEPQEEIADLADMMRLDAVEVEDDMLDAAADAEEANDMAEADVDADEMQAEAVAALAPLELTPELRSEPLRARVLKMSREAFNAQFEPEDGEDSPEHAAEIGQEIGETGLSAEDEADLLNELAAVEAESQSEIAARADAEAEALDAGAQAEDPVEAMLAAVEDAEEAASEADEAHETAEAPDWAAAEAEDAEASEAGEAADDADADREAIKRDLRAAVEGSMEPQEPAVDRLLAQTNTEMESDEGSRRRSAIAHLKAAVAAVRADGGREAMSPSQTDDNLEEYRGDLARVVRPDAAETAEEAEAAKAAEEEADKAEPATDELPNAEVEPVPHPTPRHPQDPTSAVRTRVRRRLPPLMLVSELRIDKPTAEDVQSGPVLPRRVRAEDDLDLAEEGDDEAREGTGVFVDGMSYDAFVSETGAEGLGELIEASAAFAVYVKGDKVSSRKQIMQRVQRHLPEDSFTREEALRAFGVLLREGRIQRIKRGQFTVADSTRFNPDHNEAAAS